MVKSDAVAQELGQIVPGNLALLMGQLQPLGQGEGGAELGGEVLVEVATLGAALVEQRRAFEDEGDVAVGGRPELVDGLLGIDLEGEGGGVVAVDQEVIGQIVEGALPAAGALAHRLPER